jgi:hypothetical protein
MADAFDTARHGLSARDGAEIGVSGMDTDDELSPPAALMMALARWTFRLHGRLVRAAYALERACAPTRRGAAAPYARKY